MATSTTTHVESVTRRHSAVLPLQTTQIRSLSRAEVRRRLVHMTPGCLPFVLHYLHGERPLPWSVLIEATVLTVVFTTLSAYYFRNFARRGEVFQVSKVVSYSVVALPMLFLFRQHPELAAVVLTALSFGDGSATLFGIMLGRRSLPWNASKTWVGLMAFFVCALVPTALAYWEVATPGVPVSLALKCSVFAVFFAGIAESLTAKGDDNLRVGLAAAVGVLLAQTLFVGWPATSLLTD